MTTANRGEHTPSDTGSGLRRRPTGWIILSCVLAAAVIGLGVWALNEQSNADDAQAKLASQAQTAAAATPAPTATAPTPAAATPAPADAATQQKFEQIANELGATSDSVDEIAQQLDQASAKVEGAEKARDDAKGALDTAKAELNAFKARVELTSTCLRGTLGAVGSAFEGGGLEAAVQELKTLSGNCSSAASS